MNGRLTFKQFMEKGFEGFLPTLEDWKLHSNLYFPEIRLRNFIEIRNHDCVGNGLEFSIPALYKGIMYSKSALEEVENLLNKYTTNEIKELRYKVARNAIDSKIEGKSILPICKELAEISYYSLKTEGENEEKYIEPFRTKVDYFVDTTHQYELGVYKAELQNFIKEGKIKENEIPFKELLDGSYEVSKTAIPDTSLMWEFVDKD
jgi:gamma-glutamylcysteine synthetase